MCKARIFIFSFPGKLGVKIILGWGISTTLTPKEDKTHGLGQLWIAKQVNETFKV